MYSKEKMFAESEKMGLVNWKCTQLPVWRHQLGFWANLRKFTKRLIVAKLDEWKGRWETILCKIKRRFQKRHSRIMEMSASGSFGCFLVNFCKEWLNSESRVSKVLCTWFKVHSMRNIWLSFRNNNIKFKISKSGCFFG